MRGADQTRLASSSVLVDRTVVTPQPPYQSFASDNAAGAHPQVIEALRAANAGGALAYGQDPWTTRSAERFRALFEADVEVFYTYGGRARTSSLSSAYLRPTRP